MPTFRLSVVQYLNTVPVIWGMLHGGQKGKFDLDFTTPSRCADAVRAGTADAGIIPSIEVLRIGGLSAVAGVSISALDRVRSVILISKRPIEEVRSVSLDTSSRTSAALTTILLRNFYGLQPDFTPAAPDPAAMLQSADAALLIGDPALVFDPQVIEGGAGLRVYDLAAEWKKFTSLPFVFALWAGPASDAVARFSQDFRDSRDFGLAHLDDIAAEHAPRHGISPEDVKIYLSQNINYNLDEEQREGLRTFYRLAREEGLIQGADRITFV